MFRSNIEMKQFLIQIIVSEAKFLSTFFFNKTEFREFVNKKILIFVFVIVHKNFFFCFLYRNEQKLYRKKILCIP